MPKLSVGKAAWKIQKEESNTSHTSPDARLCLYSFPLERPDAAFPTTYILTMEPKDAANKKASLLYRAIRCIVWLFYPKTEVVSADNIPTEPTLIVGNHAQMDGPISYRLYSP